MFTRVFSKKYWIVLVTLTTSIAAVSVFSYLLVASSQQKNQAFANSYTREQIITAVNSRRIDSNLKPLIQNSKLNRSAQAKSDDMINSNPSYFSHISPTNKKWSDFIIESGYDYKTAGENLANGYDSVNIMVDSWMQSPSHKENILNSGVEDTGVGISYGKLDQKPTIFVTQHFGNLN
ncbi:MAG: CAP domain-containing protein [Patescibacteria group bacterium]